MVWGVVVWLDGERSAALRRQSPITGYIGANGSGKSLLAVGDALGHLDRGRVVLSTVRLVDPESDEPCDDPTCTYALHPEHGRAHPLWRPLLTWQDLLNAESCHVILDEITGIASSRESQGLPGEIADRMMQFRRRDVTVAWTAPSWARCDLLLREVTQCAVLCRGVIRRRAAGQTWRASTLVASRMVDARDLDELTQAQRLGTARAPLRTIVRGMMLVSRSRGAGAYRTLDSVASLHRSSTRGQCLSCGGTRTAARCRCGSETAVAVEPRDDARRAATSHAGQCT